MKICDFGLARAMGAELKKTKASVMTDYVATRWYRAPELLLGYKEYDYAGNRVISAIVSNIEIINSRYVVGWLHSRRTTEKKSVPSWN